MFRQAYLYFSVLLLILVIGFWPSYFSRLDQQHSFGQHFHSIIMLLWCLLLISQAWLIRNKQVSLHRQMGRLSFVLGPLVIVSAFYVAFDFIGTFKPPYPDAILAIHWFGLFLAVLFTFLFSMAIYFRQTPQLHARYMISTAFVFLMPGLGRAVRYVVGTFDGQPPSLFTLMFVPLMIGCLLIFMDVKRRANARPFIYFTVAWGANIILFKTLPQADWWGEFTLWCHQLMATVP